MTLRILITGAYGQLGQSFKSLTDYAEQHGMSLQLTDSDTLNICDRQSIAQAFEQLRPQVVVNGAAYTAVDKAEDEIEKAEEINAVGASYIAEACAERNCNMIQVSTDYVFDGSSQKPYIETDPTAPLSVYGRTKLAGEQAVLKALPEAIIFRTSWVFSEYGQNFLKTMLRLGRERDELGIVSDQVGGPTYAPHIALAILRLIQLQSKDPSVAGETYHFSGTPITHWHAFATFIFETAKQMDDAFSIPTINAIKTADYPTAAPRPANSALSTEKLSALIPDLQCDWQQGTQQAVRALLAQEDG